MTTAADKKAHRKRSKPSEAIQQSVDPDAIWMPAQAAKYIGASVAFLARKRRTGGGPRFVMLSKTRVGYRKRALDEYVAANEFASSAEASEAESGAGPEGEG